jgi:tetratricopeptide (TPR) repeat protein
LQSDRAREAEPHLRRALAIRQAQLPAGSWRIGNVQGYLGECLLALGRNKEAEEMFLQANVTLRADPDTPKVHRDRVARDLVALYDQWHKPELARHWKTELPSTP